VEDARGRADRGGGGSALAAAATLRADRLGDGSPDVASAVAEIFGPGLRDNLVRVVGGSVKGGQQTPVRPVAYVFTRNSSARSPP